MDLSYLLSSSLAPVQEQVVNNLGFTDFPNLQKVSLGVRESTQGHLYHNDHNINRKLMRFFKDPNGFRWLQGETGALIIGKWARAFFTNATASVNELSLIVENNEHHTMALVDFLVLHGYSKSTMDYGFGDIQDPITTTDLYQKEDTDQKMLFVYIEKSPNPVLELLSRPFNSASLNLISSDRAYALLPKQTFLDKIIYCEPRGIRDVRDEIAEGFKPVGWVDETSQGSLICSAVRRIGDKHTWTIDLDTTGFSKTSGRPRAVLESTTFKITRSYGAHRSRYEHKFFFSMAPCYIIKAPILAHTYTLWQAPVMKWSIQRDKVTPTEKLYGLHLSFLRSWWHEKRMEAAEEGEECRLSDDDLMRELDQLWDELQESEKHGTADPATFSWSRRYRTRDPW
jgi:hypothetical protein